MKVLYEVGYGKGEELEVRALSYCPSDDVIILILEDYTTLHATWIEKKNGVWVAGVPDNY